MPKIPGINYRRAVKALSKAGFSGVREDKHIVISDGGRILAIPGANPVNAFTMGGIVRDAGLSKAGIRKLLWRVLSNSSIRRTAPNP